MTMIEVATWALVGIGSISLLSGAIYWLTYASLMFGKMLEELKQIRLCMQGVTTSQKKHERRITVLEQRCNIKQLA